MTKNATMDLAAVASDAERVAGEAEALIAALEEKVKAGDESVSPEQIQAARDVSRFAKLRADGARRRAARARVDDAPDSDHTHTPDGWIIRLSVMQDALEAPCAACGKRTGGSRARCGTCVSGHIEPLLLIVCRPIGISTRRL